MGKKIKSTGERLVTSIYNRNTLEHLHRYAIARNFSHGKIVLDIACGEGYGSNLLAEVASEVVGVDISAETIKDAASKYKKPNLNFQEGSTDRIPAKDSSFDVVVSFETIEHHDRHDEMMKEIKRVLKEEGVLIISSPNKLNYSDNRNYQNQFHVKELYEDEFKTLMEKNFRCNFFLNQRVLYGSVLIPEKGSSSYTGYNGNFDAIQQTDDFAALFIVCISSDKNIITEPGLTIFSDDLMYQSFADTYRKSMSYRLGNFLLRPFNFMKRIVRR